jgi:hypothetical protein
MRGQETERYSVLKPLSGFSAQLNHWAPSLQSQLTKYTLIVYSRLVHNPSKLSRRPKAIIARNIESMNKTIESNGHI